MRIYNAYAQFKIYPQETELKKLRFARYAGTTQLLKEYTILIHTKERAFEVFEELSKSLKEDYQDSKIKGFLILGAGKKVAFLNFDSDEIEVI